MAISGEEKEVRFFFFFFLFCFLNAERGEEETQKKTKERERERGKKVDVSPFTYRKVFFFSSFFSLGPEFELFIAKIDGVFHPKTLLHDVTSTKLNFPLRDVIWGTRKWTLIGPGGRF